MCQQVTEKVIVLHWRLQYLLCMCLLFITPEISWIVYCVGLLCSLIPRPFSPPVFDENGLEMERDVLLPEFLSCTQTTVGIYDLYEVLACSLASFPGHSHLQSLMRTTLKWKWCAVAISIFSYDRHDITSCFTICMYAHGIMRLLHANTDQVALVAVVQQTDGMGYPVPENSLI